MVYGLHRLVTINGSLRSRMEREFSEGNKALKILIHEDKKKAMEEGKEEEEKEKEEEEKRKRRSSREKG
jgi:hypothetical protein